jgi:hypothetical protein
MMFGDLLADKADPDVGLSQRRDPSGAQTFRGQ